MNTEKFKRGWIISDIHFGVRSSSREWLDIHKDYFHNFFMPLLRKNKKDGDVLLVLGDVFESRQYINILVMNEALKIFTELSKIMPIIMIVGNHDIFKKYSNDVTSVEIFSNIKNIKILKDPEIIKFDGADALFMPWQDSRELEQKVLESHKKTDYLFCHTNIAGFKYNRKVKVDDGLTVDSISSYKAVYTGHIHYAQKKRNIRMVGCPFEITRSDIGNVKSIWCVDFRTGNETEYQNTHSPRFIRMKLSNLIEFTRDEIQRKVENNFVDIYVSDEWSTKFPFSRFTEMFKNYRNIEFILTGGDADTLSLAELDGNGTLNIETLIDNYVDNLTFSENVKERLKEVGKKYHQIVEKNRREKQ